MATTDDSRVRKPPRRAQTCETCKARHQKCNGARPQCNNCELRSLSCSYGGHRPRSFSQAILPINRPPDLHSSLLGTATGITDTQYAHLRDQLLDDILRGVYYRDGRHVLPQPAEDRQHHDQVQAGDASLSAFHCQIADLLKNYTNLDVDSPSLTAGYDRDPPLTKTTSHARKILADLLPPRDKSQRLLDMFFQYQNSVFYVCKITEAQEQLNLMYEDAESVSLAWFCQMFLVFSVGARFDDVDEDEGALYHDLGRKHLDEALSEDPENNLWVLRAMLLICFYQPPTKWTTLWIYLDTAIRKAHRHQLDLGHNPSQGLTDEAYQEWRQVWLTVVSFDRWVAVFLGRLPHIKESISRDPIFKGCYVQQGSDHCVSQDSVTSLSIILGYVLRDMYFSQTPSQAVFQVYQKQLETWLINLPGPLREVVEPGIINQMAQEQYEVAFNLFFMYHGAWMILTKPMLLQAVEMIASTKSSSMTAASLPSTGLAEARTSVEHAIKLINNAESLLSVSLPPKRLFMPVFFLVYAAHAVILGIAWRLWAEPGNAQPDALADDSVETSAINTAIRILDFCGQRNKFARKYSLLIKDLQSQLNREQSSAGRISMASSAATSTSPYGSSQMMGIQGMSSPDFTSFSESLAQVDWNRYTNTIPDEPFGPESGTSQSLAGVDPTQHSPPADLDSMNFEHWLETGGLDRAGSNNILP